MRLSKEKKVILKLASKDNFGAAVNESLSAKLKKNNKIS